MGNAIVPLSSATSYVLSRPLILNCPVLASAGAPGTPIRTSTPRSAGFGDTVTAPGPHLPASAPRNADTATKTNVTNRFDILPPERRQALFSYSKKILTQIVEIRAHNPVPALAAGQIAGSKRLSDAKVAEYRSRER